MCVCVRGCGCMCAHVSARVSVFAFKTLRSFLYAECAPLLRVRVRRQTNRYKKNCNEETKRNTKACATEKGTGNKTESKDRQRDRIVDRQTVEACETKR